MKTTKRTFFNTTYNINEDIFNTILIQIIQIYLQSYINMINKTLLHDTQNAEITKLQNYIVCKCTCNNYIER